MTPEGFELLEVKEPIGYIVTISFSHSDKVAISFGGCLSLAFLDGYSPNPSKPIQPDSTAC